MRVVRRLSVVLLSAVFFSLGVIQAQRAAAQFHSDVEMVTLDVCVRDRAGRFVAGLAPEDFLVLEDGRPQQVSIFATAEQLPLNVVLLLDRSASMSGEKLEKARAAAAMFVERLRPDDRLEIIAFNQRATVVPSRAVSPDATALAALTARGSTALYDAMVVAAHQVRRGREAAARETRDVIIVLSDGEDTSSLIDFDEVQPVLRRSGALVYGISLRVGPHGEWLGATWPLQQLARDTGALAVGVPRLEMLTDLYAQIADEARRMYRVGYVSSNASRRGWREVKVRVNAPDSTARTRAGYYAGSRPSTR